jgi:DNA-binding SARP family transcriptional activator
MTSCCECLRARFHGRVIAALWARCGCVDRTSPLHHATPGKLAMMAVSAPTSAVVACAAMPAASICLRLLGDFELSVDGTERVLPIAGQRLLAFCALHRDARARSVIAGGLWPDAAHDEASTRLRRALWRTTAVAPAALVGTRSTVRLPQTVAVDIEVCRRAILIIASDAPDEAAAISQAAWSGPGSCAVIDLLRKDLLPMWDDEWLLFERERWRQQRVHALEQVAWQLGLAGRYEQGVDVALCAIDAEPLRESARRILVRLHLAEGNRSEAIREVRRFGELCRRELGLPPSPSLLDLVATPPERSSVTDSSLAVDDGSLSSAG